MINVFIGYDQTEAVAAQVLAHSIWKNASRPVAISLLVSKQLKACAKHTRERHPLQSTEFSFTRFLVPYLMGYNGYGIFLDCDMLVLDDITKLVDDALDPYAPVSCVMHNHKPVNTTKMRGATQTTYSMKNWSSVMVFWCAHKDCANLTPEYVNTATGLDLHQFKWLNTGKVGRLPFRWNHLVGYDEQVPVEGVSLLHWTEGGPWWPEFKDTEYSDVWFREYEEMTNGNG